MATLCKGTWVSLCESECGNFFASAESTTALLQGVTILFFHPAGEANYFSIVRTISGLTNVDRLRSYIRKIGSVSEIQYHNADQAGRYVQRMSENHRWGRSDSPLSAMLRRGISGPRYCRCLFRMGLHRQRDSPHSLSPTTEFQQREQQGASY